MELMELMQTRRTYRRFEEDRPVPQAVIDDILSAARLSSCAGNMQNLRYLVVRSPEAVGKVFPLTRWAAALPKELGTPKEGQRPPLYILVVCDREKRNKWTDTDAGIALGNMTLAAWAHGVGSCIMDNIDRPGLKSALGLAEELEIHSAVAFGYPTHRSSVVPVPESGSLRYYLDENLDYCVPKKSTADIAAYL